MMQRILLRQCACALAATLVIAAVPSSARTQTTTQPAKPATLPATAPSTQPFGWHSNDREFTVTPAFADGPGAPDPLVLTYTMTEQSSGDAAVAYTRAFAWHAGKLYDPEYTIAINAAQEETPATIDPEQVRAEVLYRHGTDMELVEQAATRRPANWDHPWREEGFNALLPSLNNAREFANLFHIRGKVLAAEGNLDAMLRDARVLIIMGNHVGAYDGAFLVEGLVGLGIAQQGLTLIRQSGELPGAPSTYWPLATARLDFNFRAFLELERAAMLAAFPELQRPDDFTAEKWASLMADLSMLMDYQSGGVDDPDRAAAIAEALIPRARAWARHSGMSEAEVEAMGDYPLLARYMLGSYDYFWKQAVAAVALPVPAARQRIAEIEAAMADPAWEGTLSAAVFPTLGRAYDAFQRIERDRSALMLVEAIRDHAAGAGGLPTSLDELRLAIPNDPFSNEPFEYSVDGEIATIVAHPFRENDPSAAFTWKVRLAEPGPLADPSAELPVLPDPEIPDDPMAPLIERLRKVQEAANAFATSSEDNRYPKDLEELVEAEILTAEQVQALSDLTLAANGATGRKLYDSFYAAGIADPQPILAYAKAGRDAEGSDRTFVIHTFGIIRSLPLDHLRDSLRIQGVELQFAD